MATRRRTTTRRRKTSGRSRKTLSIKISASIAREIWAVIYLSLGILTILSLQGAFGVIGEIWVNMLSPIVGWGIYVIPGVFILVSLMMFFSKKVNFGASRVFGMFLFLVSILSIIHLSVPPEEIHNYAAQGRYGGYTGFVTNFILLEVLRIGQVAAATIFVAMFLVAMLLVFEIPLREMLAFLIPKFKIELVRPPKTTRVEDRQQRRIEEEDRDDDPEEKPIMIRKSLIGAHRDIDKIYAEDNSNPFVNDSSEKEVERELTESQAKVTEDNDYEWEFPSLDLLKDADSAVAVDDSILMDNADIIKKKLNQFGIHVVMHEVNVGPTVIQYTLKPDAGVKLSKITTLKNDLALALAADGVRIEAPIPGKSLVGIEVPNPYRAIVHLREILESAEFTDANSKLTLPIGRNVSGRPVIGNLEAMPHLLVAGATGSGKSIAMNTFLLALLYQNSPKDLRMIMIDPKRVELSSYNSIPHLLTPVIQEPDKAAVSLRWAVAEMTRRYTELSANRVRNINEYNDLKDTKTMSRIIIVIDELADLMMAAGKEVEASICRLAQMARAVGIHLIIATQRPSVDVITGLIKANIPSRISFSVASSIDSRTILDGIGAEDLLGKGDMLYLPNGMNKPVRIQGIYVSTDEIEKVTNRVKLTVEPNYDESITSSETAAQSVMGVPDSKAGSDEDTMYEEAFRLVIETRKASASLLQRRLKLGYARAARLIDLLEENGIVGPANGSKPRKILLDEA